MSNSQDYANSILNAIDIIVDRSITQAKFDQTIQATVISCEDEVRGKYKVKYQDAYYYVTADNLSNVYTKGSQVYILVPGSDFSKPKKIIGSVSNSESVYVVPSLDEQFITIGNNCSLLKEELALSSYDKTSGPLYFKTLYDENSANNLLEIDNASLKFYMESSPADYFRIGASFKTNIKKAQQIGVYGIRIYIKLVDDDTKEENLKTYVLNNLNMEGTPYTFINYSTQNQYFDIEGEDFEKIYKVEFFTENFSTKEKKDIDIWIKDIEIAAVERNSFSPQNPYSLNIRYPKGAILNDRNESVELAAEVIVNNKKASENDLKFYWFIKDNSILTNNKYYSSLAGVGWKGLTGYNTIKQDELETIEWLPGASVFTIPKSLIQSDMAKIKCVAVYENSTTLSKEVSISRLDSPYEISITSSNGVNFSQDIGVTDLECKIKGTENLEGLIYRWTKTSSANTIESLDNGFIGGITNKELIEKTEQLKKNIEEYSYNATIVIEEISTNMQTSSLDAKTVTTLLIDFYNKEAQNYNALLESINTRLSLSPIFYQEDNRLCNIAAKTINNFNIYTCTVYQGENLIGSSEIKINNKIVKDATASILLENGNQVFKYTVGGLAPNHESIANPQQVKALTFRAYDENGIELNEEKRKNNCVAFWYVPVENSMIKLENTQGLEQVQGCYKIQSDMLLFNIKENFNVNYINNDIRLEVKYSEKTYQTVSSFSFIKDGEPGTNGTEFYCKIEPNSRDVLEGYPTLTYNTRTMKSTWNFELNDENKWFSAKLYKNGENISLDAESIYWKMLTNTNDKASSSHFDLEGSLEGYYGYTDKTVKFKASNKQIEHPSNVLQVLAIHDNNYYYGHNPLTFVKLDELNYKVQIKPNTGYNYVLYSSDGYNPQYPSDSAFEMEILEYKNNQWENISQSSELKYEWSSFGFVERIGKNGLPELASGLVKKEESNLYKCSFEPIDYYSGESVNLGIKCIIQKNNSQLATVYFPIYFTLNKYEHGTVSKWNGNSIALNEEDGIILSPQVIAGKKNDASNTFTGLMIGEVKYQSPQLDSSVSVGAEEVEQSRHKIGLIGFNKGAQTLFLNAETGEASFGANQEVQFNFQEGWIEDAVLDDNGNVIEEGVRGVIPEIKLGPWLLTREAMYKGSDYLGGNAQKFLDEYEKTSSEQETEQTEEEKREFQDAYNDEIIASRNQIYFGDKGLSLGHNFIYETGDPDGSKESSLVIRGKVESEEGKIGPWYIDTDSLSFGENDKFFQNETSVYLGSQGISVKKGFGIEILEDDVITTIEKGKIGELEGLNQEASISLKAKDNDTSFTSELITLNSFGYILEGEDTGDNSSDTEEEGGGDASSDESLEDGSEDESGETAFIKQNDYKAELTAKNFTLKRLDSNNTLNSYIDFNGPNNDAIFECTVNMATSPTITSDERLKEIDAIDSRYENLFMELKPIRYKLKGKEFHRKHLGYSAQEVEKALIKTGISSEEFAGLVIKGEEEEYSLRYEEFGPLYAHMLQKALNKIDKLESRIEELEAKLN